MLNVKFTHYCEVYKEYFKSSLSVSLKFRLNFVLSIIVSLLFLITSILTIKLLFFRLESIAGWDESIFLFFTVFTLLILELHNTFLTLNYWEFQNLILKGDLDFLLIKPVNPLFSSFFRTIRINALVVVPIELVVLIYYGLQINLTLLAWILLPFVILIAFMLTTILGILQSCLIFWIYQGSGVNYLRMQCANISCWPERIFVEPIKNLFTYIFPILAISGLPVNFLINPYDPKPLVILTLEIIIFAYITHKVWQKGLKHYESASS